jgi:hypothetical protein
MTDFNPIVSVRKAFAFDPAAPVNPQELINWQSQGTGFCEVELLLYPLVAGEPGAGSVVVNETAIFGVLFFELQLSQGGGVGWDTNTPLAPFPGGTRTSQFTIGAAGIRKRFACSEARLRIVGNGQPGTLSSVLNVGIFASFSPCSGVAEPRPIPDRYSQPSPFQAGGVPWPLPVPKGATEIKVHPGTSQDAIATVNFYSAGPAGIVLIKSAMVASYHDWRPIPQNAYYVVISRTPISAAPSDFGASNIVPAGQAPYADIFFR